MLHLSSVYMSGLLWCKVGNSSLRIFRLNVLDFWSEFDVLSVEIFERCIVWNESFQSVLIALCLFSQLFV